MINIRTNDEIDGGGAHGSILQHVGHDEEADHASANVDLVELRNTAVAPCHCDISQCNIEVVLSCEIERGVSMTCTRHEL